MVCGCAEDPDSESVVAAYVFLHADRFEANEFVDPIVMCNGWGRCTDAGFVYGLQAASVSRMASGGWALELEFNRDVSGTDTAALQAELNRRAETLGLGTFKVLNGSDEWPSCRGEPDCLTVDESTKG